MLVPFRRRRPLRLAEKIDTCVIRQNYLAGMKDDLGDSPRFLWY